jgi:hypothetical protein
MSTTLAFTLGLIRDPTLPFLLAREEVIAALTSWDCYKAINAITIHCGCGSCQYRCRSIAQDYFRLIEFLGDKAAEEHEDEALGAFIDEINDSPVRSE